MRAIFIPPPILRIPAGPPVPLDAGLGCWRSSRLLQPLNRLATKRFLRESRAKVWANARLLDNARRAGPHAYATRLAELERLAATRVAD